MTDWQQLILNACDEVNLPATLSQMTHLAEKVEAEIDRVSKFEPKNTSTDDEQRIDCPNCNGSGSVACKVRYGKRDYVCPVCDGKGVLWITGKSA